MGNPGLGETLLPGAKVDLSPAEGGEDRLLLSHHPWAVLTK